MLGGGGEAVAEAEVDLVQHVREERFAGHDAVAGIGGPGRGGGGVGERTGLLEGNREGPQRGARTRECQQREHDERDQRDDAHGEHAEGGFGRTQWRAPGPVLEAFAGTHLAAPTAPLAGEGGSAQQEHADRYESPDESR